MGAVSRFLMNGGSVLFIDAVGLTAHYAGRDHLAVRRALVELNGGQYFEFGFFRFFADGEAPFSMAERSSSSPVSLRTRNWEMPYFAPARNGSSVCSPF